MKNKYISVSGTMGVGKSTLTKLIAKEFGCFPFFENFKKNPFLPLFYKKMDRWAFHSQIFFLLEKCKQLESLSLRLKKTVIVQDTPVYQDVFSYGKAQLEMKNININEWRLYLKTFNFLKKRLPKPDIIFYINAPIKIIYQRIKERDRQFELVEKRKKLLNYLKILDNLNRQWLKKLSKTIKIITIDTENFDYVNNKEKRNKLYDLLKKVL